MERGDVAMNFSMGKRVKPINLLFPPSPHAGVRESKARGKFFEVIHCRNVVLVIVLVCSRRKKLVSCNRFHGETLSECLKAHTYICIQHGGLFIAAAELF